MVQVSVDDGRWRSALRWSAARTLHSARPTRLALSWLSAALALDYFSARLLRLTARPLKCSSCYDWLRQLSATSACSQFLRPAALALLARQLRCLANCTDAQGALTMALSVLCRCATQLLLAGAPARSGPRGFAVDCSSAGIFQRSASQALGRSSARPPRAHSSVAPVLNRSGPRHSTTTALSHCCVWPVSHSRLDCFCLLPVTSLVFLLACLLACVCVNSAITHRSNIPWHSPTLVLDMAAQALGFWLLRHSATLANGLSSARLPQAFGCYGAYAMQRSVVPVLGSTATAPDARRSAPPI
jgi:hypothetical protein